MHADFIALMHSGVNTDMGIFGGGPEMAQLPYRRQELTSRILGIDTCFNGVTADCKLLLLTGHRFTRCNQQLPLHQIKTGNHLGNRMLNLKPGVHLHKIEGTILIKKKLDRAGTDVLDGSRSSNSRSPHLLPERCGHP